MAFPKFHIVVDGPADTSFTSFSSSDLQQGDLSKITLAMIRNKSAVPNKFFFTDDGKSKVDDTTTLAYYMSLSVEGQKILHSGKQVTADKPEAKPEAEPGVHTFKVQVTKKATAAPASLVPLPPTTDDGLSKLLDSISNGQLARGTLPTFSDRSLHALSSDYAASSASADHAEPADLDGNQWNTVIKNNRALTGYYYQWTKDAQVLVKARKPAFNLRGAATVGEPPASDAGAAQVKVPAIPPFYIDDDASVDVTEIRNQFQQTLVQEGFNSVAVSGSIGGGAASIPATVTASFEKEHSAVNSTSTTGSVDSLMATYNFPRVVIELEPECLELTDECKQDAMLVTDETSKDRFLRKYGTVFVTKFTLGGYLYSTRNVTGSEKSSLNQIKDRTRVAVGASIQTPKASGGANFAKVDSTGTETGTASLFQDARLTWNARGGDTILCSNPPVWASTVKNYKLWRLMNQQRLVSLEGLMKDVDVLAWQKINNPSVTPPPSGDITKDSQQARVTLINALADPDNSAMVQAIRKYYQDNKFEQGANLETYNAWSRKTFPQDTDAIIGSPTVFAALSIDQKVGFGLYMAGLKVLRVV